MATVEFSNKLFLDDKLEATPLLIEVQIYYSSKQCHLNHHRVYAYSIITVLNYLQFIATFLQVFIDVTLCISVVPSTQQEATPCL